ncbi:hypothetical protein OC846_001839 [Tilletia horrida]|uniref:Cutinase n=1 Tax=Tilletia horrida TaxID=155126 RepID=A0AAN6GT80_9BASI|nr:hypothetical protein OC845_001571 [Tilletia horrida]KAK0555158.1 hypothetical protein OC846_001839 [Tilletia horrida]KAK0568428.1 hypothetical protein OC861_001985 [Tilletia horrida]
MLGLNLVTVTLALLGTSVSKASPLERRACTKYEIIHARGTFQPNGSTEGFTGMLNTVLNTRAGGSNYSVVYPASLDFSKSIPQGVADLSAHLKASIAACPTRNYTLIGYSQGAEVMNEYLINVTSTSNATIYNRIKAIVYVGNPSHTPYTSSNFDENGGTSTNPYIGSYKPKTPKLTQWLSKLHDICYNYDDICANNQSKPFGQGSNHGKYEDDTNVQNQGAQFILAKLPA